MVFKTIIALMAHFLLNGDVVTINCEPIHKSKTSDDNYPSYNRGNISALLREYPEFVTEYPCSSHFKFMMLHSL